MTNLFKIALISVAMALTSATFTLAANAGDPQIDAAIAEGVIGERIDGYLGVVSGEIDPAVLRKMNDINNQRRALYAKLAEDTNTTTAQVARLTGEKQIAKAPPGAFVMTESGGWTQK